jgi:peptidoglycan/LPS O-acetylase OafA/YrhL
MHLMKITLETIDIAALFTLPLYGYLLAVTFFTLIVAAFIYYVIEWPFILLGKKLTKNEKKCL